MPSGRAKRILRRLLLGGIVLYLALGWVFETVTYIEADGSLRFRKKHVVLFVPWRGEAEDSALTSLIRAHCRPTAGGDVWHTVGVTHRLPMTFHILYLYNWRHARWGVRELEAMWARHRFAEDARVFLACEFVRRLRETQSAGRFVSEIEFALEDDPPVGPVTVAWIERVWREHEERE